MKIETQHNLCDSSKRAVPSWKITKKNKLVNNATQEFRKTRTNQTSKECMTGNGKN